MQQEFVEFKKRSADEMEVLRQENSRLRRRIEIEATNDKDKEEEIHVDLKTPLCNMTEEESELYPSYNDRYTCHHYPQEQTPTSLY